MSDITAKSVPQDSREASTGLLARLCAAVSFGVCCTRALPLSSVPPPVVVAAPVAAEPVAAVAVPVVAAPAAFAVIARAAAPAAPDAADPAPSSEDDLVVSRTESLQSE